MEEADKERISSMAKVIKYNGVTKLDLPPDRILETAKDGIGDGVVVLGWDKEDELYFASSLADGGDVLWLLEKAKQRLLMGE
jgi:hypothetical protein